MYVWVACDRACSWEVLRAWRELKARARPCTCVPEPVSKGGIQIGAEVKPALVSSRLPEGESQDGRGGPCEDKARRDLACVCACPSCACQAAAGARVRACAAMRSAERRGVRVLVASHIRGRVKCSARTGTGLDMGKDEQRSALRGWCSPRGWTKARRAVSKPLPRRLATASQQVAAWPGKVGSSA